MRVLNSLHEQVHGKKPYRPDYLASEVELLTADVRDSNLLDRALRGVDSVVHLAASVGVGQGVYSYARNKVSSFAVCLRAVEILSRTLLFSGGSGLWNFCRRPPGNNR